MAQVTVSTYSGARNRYGKAKTVADTGTAPARVGFAAWQNEGGVLSLRLEDEGDSRLARVNLRGPEVVKLALFLLGSVSLEPEMREALQRAERDNPDSLKPSRLLAAVGA